MREKEILERWPHLFGDTLISADCPDGWDGLVIRVLDYIKVGTVAQIKEKFGGLRIYVDNADAAEERMIDAAETASCWVCEACGTTKDVSRDPWWQRTLCEGCRSIPTRDGGTPEPKVPQDT